MEKNVCLWKNCSFLRKNPFLLFNFTLFGDIKEKLSTISTMFLLCFPPKFYQVIHRFFALFWGVHPSNARFSFVEKLSPRLFIHIFAKAGVDNPVLSTFCVDKWGFCAYAYLYICIFSTSFSTVRQNLTIIFPQRFFRD